MEHELIRIAVEQTSQRFNASITNRTRNYSFIENDDDKLVIVAQELMVYTFTREELEKILKDHED